MSDVEYGVTQNGFIRKRYDVIFTELQARLSDNDTGFGFDVASNPQSFLNMMLASFAGKVNELWQLAEQVYFSQYISSAEGVSLDNAAAFGGVKRQLRTKSRFYMSCTGVDGTTLQAGTKFSTQTNPKVTVENDENYYISRSNCTDIKISVNVVASGAYTITINNIAFTYTNTGSDTESDILTGLNTALNDATNSFFDHTISSNELVLTPKDVATDPSVATVNREVAISDNLKTGDVTSCFVFYCTEYGPVYVPEGKITQKVSTPVNLKTITNIGEPVLGRNTETDVEFRQSYIKKIASRSSTMLDSIVSGILTGVQDIVSCTAYENQTDVASTVGTLPIDPHSVLVIVDCPESRDMEVAQMILKKKAAGINTNGVPAPGRTVVVKDVQGVYTDPVTIRFYKPSPKTIYIQVEYVRNSDPLPSNYKQIITDTIIEQCSGLKAGDLIVPQDWISALKTACSGISYFDIQVKDSLSAYANTYQLGVLDVPDITDSTITINDPN